MSKFKGTITKWPVQKLTHRTRQKHVQHHDVTDILTKIFCVFFIPLRFLILGVKLSSDFVRSSFILSRRLVKPQVCPSLCIAWINQVNLFILSQYRFYLVRNNTRMPSISQIKIYCGIILMLALVLFIKL